MCVDRVGVGVSAAVIGERAITWANRLVSGSAVGASFKPVCVSWPSRSYDSPRFFFWLGVHLERRSPSLAEILYLAPLIIDPVYIFSVTKYQRQA